ncbi:hypothetical protein JTE90_026187 [Oedothorax gibbosus]|uniref:LIM zinc-binding domain-containing protein n=1 Tax=Oedothorax gibbosus TaxID=931172 RepID=A0AAV6UF85_9ARAC|nr:hypothetical protein JTE90_026187 [Oedothorax gibbosus]
MEAFSMNVIAQTLSTHSEMIAPGVMGINFMKPEKPINTMSEVYKLVQEEQQNKGWSPKPAPSGQQIFRPSKVPPSVAPKPVVNAAPPAPAPAPPASAPAPMPVLKPVAPPAPEGPSQGPCSDCGRNITGPFVSLSDRTLHQECFNCSTCGSSLQNIGFHNINNKLYCETHAKLAARVIASNACPPSPVPPTFSAPPAPVPQAPPAAPLPQPIQDLPRSQLAPQAAAAPSLPQSSLYQPVVPTPWGQNLSHLPQTPSSSGNLTFRSISPQPFKRISGEFHRVNAPSSPTPGSGPSISPLAYASGPLPFEMKPYMPPEQTRSSLFSSVGESTQQSTTEMSSSQTTQVTQQVVQQKTTQVSSHSSSVYAMDYKQVVGGQSKTKFVWPPPKSEFEIDGSSPQAPQTQNYSPLVSMPQQQQDNSAQQPAFRSVQAPQPQETAVADIVAPVAPPPAAFTVPPLPSSFPQSEPLRPQEPAPAAPVSLPPAPAPMAPLPQAWAPPPQAPAPYTAQGSTAQNFAPVLPPVLDPQQPASSAPAQPGVPVGAGSKPAPKKGRGQLMSTENVPGRIPICGDCGEPIRGPFIVALNRTWCPDHFHCNNVHCKTPLIDVGFVEEQGQLYCEQCYEQFLAPVCSKCNVRIKGVSLAIKELIQNCTL